LLAGIWVFWRKCVVAAAAHNTRFLYLANLCNRPRRKVSISNTGDYANGHHLFNIYIRSIVEREPLGNLFACCMFI